MRIGTNWKRFTASHRLAWHPKCSRIHGHGFQVRVLVEGEVNPDTGIVVDFGEVGAAISEIIDPLDHRFLAARDAKRGHWDSEMYMWSDCEMCVSDEAQSAYLIDGKYVLPAEDVVVLPLQHVSTEALAGWFLQLLVAKPWAPGKTVTVQVSETGENVAEVTQFVPKPDDWLTYTYASTGKSWLTITNNNTIAVGPPVTSYIVTTHG